MIQLRIQDLKNGLAVNSSLKLVVVPEEGDRTFRPWRRASPAAACGGGLGGGGAVAGRPVQLGQPSVAAGEGSSAAGPRGAALCGMTRTPVELHGAHPGTSEPSLGSRLGQHLGRRTKT